MKEVIEMACMLLEMGTDTYMKSKCMLLAVSREHPGERHFFEVLFNSVEKKRPLLIEDKRGGGRGMKDDSSKPIEWRSADYHRKEILKILDTISDSWILWQMHRFIVNITRED